MLTGTKPVPVDRYNVCPGKRLLNLVQSYLYALPEIVSASCFHCVKPRHCLRDQHLAKAKPTIEHTGN